MSQLRQGDIALYHTPDGGEMTIINGEPVMDAGFETATYLSLFGGDGESHWMHEYQSESEKVYGKFYNFIRGNTKTVANLNKAEDLAKQDLQWFIDDGIADTIIVSITSLSANDIELESQLLLNCETLSENKFKINWGYQKDYPAHERV